MPKYITIPKGAYIFKKWKVGGFTEVKVKGKTYRHYCLSKVRFRKSGAVEEIRGYNAMTQKESKGWRGVLISDTSYYARNMKPIDLVKQLRRKKKR